MKQGLRGQRLVATFMLGCVMLNYPVLFLFTGPTWVAGVPLLYLYLFGVWGLLIAVMALVIERPRD